MKHQAQLRPALLGIAIALAALVLAVLAAGPVLRSIIGNPAGFGSDYTSVSAYVQAGVAQCASLALSYFLLGLVTRNRATTRLWQLALWAANPLTVGFAYWLLRLTRRDEWPYEYTAFHGWLVLAIAAPILFAPCIYFGARIGQKQS